MSNITTESSTVSFRYLNFQILIMLVAIICCLSACVKESLYETDHPNHGKITLTTTWDERGENVHVPVSYKANIGNYTETLKGTSNSVENLFLSGQYVIHIYNEAENILVSGTTATANYAAGGIGWLFTGTGTIDVEKDKNHYFTVAMHQQVRQLTLKFDVEGDAKERIIGVDATLSGVAKTIDIENGNPNNDTAIVPLSFVSQTSPTVSFYTATTHLLGIVGMEQILSLTLHFADGNPRSFTLLSDLSDALDTFNFDKKIPLSLTSGITVTITPLDVNAEISDWEKDGDETVIAD